MNLPQPFLLAIMAITLTVVGCSKQGEVNVETSRLESAFSGAESSLKAAADKAVTAIKNADYSGALSELKSLAASVKLTDSQKQAVNDIIAQVQKALSEGMSKAADGASKAIGEAQKSLGK